MNKALTLVALSLFTLTRGRQPNLKGMVRLSVINY
jgi:hypothetical protein